MPLQAFPFWSLYGAFAFRFAAGFAARGAASDGAASVANSSSVLPAASASRSQCGRGPRPSHWLPWPLEYFADVDNVLAFDALPVRGTGNFPELEPNPSCSAVRP